MKIQWKYNCVIALQEFLQTDWSEYCQYKSVIKYKTVSMAEVDISVVQTRLQTTELSIQSLMDTKALANLLGEYVNIEQYLKI